MSPIHPLCKYYNTSRGCRYGDKCRFAHPSERTEPIECRYHNTAMGCRYGNDCLFKHEDLACVCFKCQENFGNVQGLRSHMKAVLARCKPDHLGGILDYNGSTNEILSCSACCNIFEGLKAILQHIGSKAEHDDKHSKLLDKVVAHFVERCLGACSDQEAWKNRLFEEILSAEQAHDDLGKLFSALLQLHDNDIDYSDSDDSEMEERMNNCGFTNEEAFELLCQGVKPWDDDAWDVMAVLNGDY